jgi:succinate dehydrogenase flavin-adding protein (antitoxin of CptAB toxin-antitoxin module)
MSNRIFKITFNFGEIGSLPSIPENCINIEHMGTLVSKALYTFKFEQTSYFVNSMSKLKTPDASEITGKSFYRHPDINLPRDKFDILKEKHGCKVVKNSNQADYQIISVKGLASFIERTGYEKVVNKYNIMMSKLRNDQSVIDLFDDAAYEKIMKFHANTNSKDVIIIDFNPTYGHTGTRLGTKFNDLRHEITDYNNLFYITDENAKKLNDMINKGNLVLDSHMYSFADEHMTTLNEEDYRNLVKMIEASNDDRELAVNIIANSNIKTSYDKIAMLCYYFGFRLKETKGYNSAGFKVLRKVFAAYFTGPALNQPYAYNYLIDKLSLDNALTEFAFKESVVLYFNYVVRNMLGHDSNQRVFTIDINAIKLSPKYKLVTLGE